MVLWCQTVMSSVQGNTINTMATMSRLFGISRVRPESCHYLRGIITHDMRWFTVTVNRELWNEGVADFSKRPSLDLNRREQKRKKKKRLLERLFETLLRLHLCNYFDTNPITSNSCCGSQLRLEHWKNVLWIYYLFLSSVFFGLCMALWIGQLRRWQETGWGGGRVTAQGNVCIYIMDKTPMLVTAHDVNIDGVIRLG